MHGPEIVKTLSVASRLAYPPGGLMTYSYPSLLLFTRPWQG